MRYHDDNIDYGERNNCLSQVEIVLIQVFRYFTTQKQKNCRSDDDQKNQNNVGVHHMN